MKILKYLFIISVILIMYITESSWRPQTNTGSAEISQIDTQIQKQQDEYEKLTSEAAEELRTLEERFGEKPTVAYKSRVPKPLEIYWKKTLLEGESIYDDICTHLKATDKGWTTTCQYKVKSKSGNAQLTFDTFYIKHGKIIK